MDLAFSSFTGMEGGNPDAAIWVCDLAQLSQCIPLAIALKPQCRPTAWDAEFRRRHADVLARWQAHFPGPPIRTRMPGMMEPSAQGAGLF